MENYSKLSIKLHHNFLGNTSLSKYLHNRLINQAKNSNHNNLNHVFITGLCRSGTTVLLNNLYLSGELKSIVYKHMPFILSPRLAVFFSELTNSNKNKFIKRYHGDGIYINFDSPESLDEVFWIKSYPENIKKPYIGRESIKQEILDGYSLLLNKFSLFQSADRLLIKNNNNHIRIKELSEHFKESIFLFMIRDPLEHAKSLLSQHINFSLKQKQNPYILEYMKLIGHEEFGINSKPFIYPNDKVNWFENKDKMSLDYWLFQWINTYKWFLEEVISSRKNIFLISYEDLCSKKYLYSKICELIKIKKHSPNLPFKLSQKTDHKDKFAVNDSYLSTAKSIYNVLLDFSFK